MKNKLIIGTRGSNLALYQANKVKDILSSAFPALHVEIIIIKTKGDKILDVALSKIGDKGLFTKELEVALEQNEIDIAVHSLKDLPTVLPSHLCLGAVLERGEHRDALISAKGLKLADLQPHHTIATSSLRRQAGILRLVPGITIKDIRGNVETRIQKMKDGYCDALIMAAAGIIRLGLAENISEIIEPQSIIPAVGQGIIAIEMRKNDPETESYISAINNKNAWTQATAERTFLNCLQGGCQIPIGAHAIIENDQLLLTGCVASTDGKKYLQETVICKTSEPIRAGAELAEKLLVLGAQEILDTIKLSGK